jgi:hypothetical protein
MKLLLRILTISLFFLIEGYAQFEVKGIIINSQDKTPLPGANVFLANTTKGTQTNSDGMFSLKNIPAGKFELVVSYIGFETLTLPIQAESKKSYRINLVPSSNDLDAVIIKARRKKDLYRQENVDYFTKNFIGQSENAIQCKLINPDVLYFNNTPEKFTARAQEPVIIENKGLGYKLKFQLDEYSVNKETQRIVYSGHVVYENLIPDNEEEEKRWVVNRKKAYYGSVMHFMRALYHRQLLEEGFMLKKIVKRPRLNRDTVLVGLPGDTTVYVTTKFYNKSNLPQQTLKYKQIIDSTLSTRVHPLLKFNDLLEITYIHEAEPYMYFKSRKNAKEVFKTTAQVSIIKLLKPNITIESDGQYFDASGIHYQGYWSWELVAEDLPVDYSP